MNSNSLTYTWDNLSKFACIKLDGKKCGIEQHNENEILWVPLEGRQATPAVISSEIQTDSSGQSNKVYRYADGSQRWIKISYNL